MNLQNLLNYSTNNNIDIFEGVSVPTPLDAELVKSAIMLRCGLLTPVYNDPNTFKEATTVWFNARQWNFKHLVNIINAEYSPIENVDRYDSTTTSHTGSNSKNSGFTNTEGGSDSHSGSYNESNSGTDTTTNTVSAFNSSGYQADSQEQMAHGHNVNNSNSESTTYGHTLNNSGSESGTDSYTDTFTQHMHGNVGVTSNVTLLMEEARMIGNFTPYEWIAKEFEKDNMIMVY